MPQTTYLTVYRADYPTLAKAQKPGGVTVLSTVSASDVPNKHVYVAGTIQSAEALLVMEEEVKEETIAEEESEEESEE